MNTAGKPSNLQSKAISATLLQSLLPWNIALRCVGGDWALAVAVAEKAAVCEYSSKLAAAGNLLSFRLKISALLSPTLEYCMEMCRFRRQVSCCR